MAGGMKDCSSPPPSPSHRATKRGRHLAHCSPDSPTFTLQHARGGETAPVDAYVAERAEHPPFGGKEVLHLARAGECEDSDAVVASVHSGASRDEEANISQGLKELVGRYVRINPLDSDHKFISVWTMEGRTAVVMRGQLGVG